MSKNSVNSVNVTDAKLAFLSSYSDLIARLVAQFATTDIQFHLDHRLFVEGKDDRIFASISIRIIIYGENENEKTVIGVNEELPWMELLYSRYPIQKLFRNWIHSLWEDVQTAWHKNCGSRQMGNDKNTGNYAQH